MNRNDVQLNVGPGPPANLSIWLYSFNVFLLLWPWPNVPETLTWPIYSAYLYNQPKFWKLVEFVNSWWLSDAQMDGIPKGWFTAPCSKSWKIPCLRPLLGPPSWGPHQPGRPRAPSMLRRLCIQTPLMLFDSLQARRCNTIAYSMLQYGCWSLRSVRL